MVKLPYIVAYLSSQGGSGKTTACVNIAAALSRMGKKVLLVDTQQDVFISYGQKAVQQPVSPRVQSADFIRLNAHLKLYRVSCSNVVLLERLFHSLRSKRREYDYIFIESDYARLDTLAAILALSHKAIICYRLGAGNPVHALKGALSAVSEARHSGNRSLDSEIFGVRLKRVSKIHLEKWEELKQQYGYMLFPMYTRDTTYENEAVNQGTPFVELFPGDDNALVYRALATELFEYTPAKAHRSLVTTPN